MTQRKDRTELIRLYNAGFTDAEIGARLDMAEKTVRNVRARLGLPGQNKRIWADRWQKIDDMRAKGKSLRAIADALGVPLSVVSNRCSTLSKGADVPQPKPLAVKPMRTIDPLARFIERHDARVIADAMKFANGFTYSELAEFRRKHNLDQTAAMQIAHATRIAA